MSVTREAVENVLRQYTDPHLNQDPVSAGCVRSIDVQGERVSVQLELGYAAGLFRSGWAQMLAMAIEGLDGVARADVQVDCVIRAHKSQEQGHVTLEFSNTTTLPAKIYANEGVAQMLFLQSDEPCEVSYRDRGGKYQGQRGVTLPKA
ncbi:dCTP deaminase, dUMP-forming [Stutzerimonas stutzeri]